MPTTHVLDCSVAAKWILPESDRTPALRLFEQYSAGEIFLIAPDLLLTEFASLLAKRRRRKQLLAEQAHKAFDLMVQCSPKLYETRPRLRRALELSLSHDISLWDSVYLALAAEFNCSVITADRRLFRAASRRHPSLKLLMAQ